jgi:transcriptional regulator
MYLPAHFEEKRVEVLQGLVRDHPLGALVSAGPDGLDANHLPFLLDGDPVPFGTLRGHVARANPVWRDIDGRDVLVIFQGPQAYVSPTWYPSKKESGKVVPTYNYAVVHAHGRARMIDGPGLREHVAQLAGHFEARAGSSWKVSDAPEFRSRA